MATLKSDEVTRATATPPVPETVPTFSGKNHTKWGTITLAGAGATDVFEMVQMKKGDRIVDVKMYNAAMTTLTTFAVGITGVDVDLFIAATSMTSAAVTRMGVTSAGNNVGYTMVQDDTIDILSAGASAVNSGVVVLEVTYVPAVPV